MYKYVGDRSKLIITEKPVDPYSVIYKKLCNNVFSGNNIENYEPYFTNNCYYVTNLLSELCERLINLDVNKSDLLNRLCNLVSCFKGCDLCLSIVNGMRESVKCLVKDYLTILKNNNFISSNTLENTMIMINQIVDNNFWVE